MAHYDCRRCGRNLANETHYCEGCCLYHWRDECTDPYFNDPENWCNCTRIFTEETQEERNDRQENDRRPSIRPRSRI